MFGVGTQVKSDQVKSEHKRSVSANGVDGLHRQSNCKQSGGSDESSGMRADAPESALTPGRIWNNATDKHNNRVLTNSGGHMNMTDLVHAWEAYMSRVDLEADWEFVDIAEQYSNEPEDINLPVDAGETIKEARHFQTEVEESSRETLDEFRKETKESRDSHQRQVDEKDYVEIRCIKTRDIQNELNRAVRDLRVSSEIMSRAADCFSMKRAKSSYIEVKFSPMYKELRKVSGLLEQTAEKIENIDIKVCEANYFAFVAKSPS